MLYVIEMAEKNTLEDLIGKLSDFMDKGTEETPYKPMTEFLKKKIANANFKKKSDREYILGLCKVENAAYKYQVKGESTGFYGSYVFLHPEEYGPYRKEFFGILKELSYQDYLKVVTMELFDPSQYGPGKQWEPFKLEDFNENDQAFIKRNLARWHAQERYKERQKKAEKKTEFDKLRKWWIDNGGKP